MVNHGGFPDHCPCEESMTGDKLIPGRGHVLVETKTTRNSVHVARVGAENFISREQAEMKCKKANHFRRCITTSKHS